MWKMILQWAVKIAFYAADHPDQVKEAVEIVKGMKAAKDAQK